MIYRLQSIQQVEKVVCLTPTAWYAILDLAELYGWYPLGGLLTGGWEDLPIPLSGYDNWDWLAPISATGLPEEGENNGNGKRQVVILEDALNLADALEQAFFEYEPLRVPPSYYLFEPEDQYLKQRPSIGALREVINICQTGSFSIEVIR